MKTKLLKKIRKKFFIAPVKSCSGVVWHSMTANWWAVYGVAHRDKYGAERKTRLNTLYYLDELKDKRAKMKKIQKYFHDNSFVIITTPLILLCIIALIINSETLGLISISLLIAIAFVVVMYAIAIQLLNQLNK